MEVMFKRNETFIKKKYEVFRVILGLYRVKIWLKSVAL